MMKLSLPIKFTIFLSLSLTASTTSSSSSLSFSKSKSSSIPKATPSDLLSVLGPTSQSFTVNPLVAKQLKSCFKFLVPFTPRKSSTRFQDYSIRRSLKDQNFKTQREQNELIWWPPESVLELARLAVDSGGDPDAIYRALDPTVLPVPDVDGCKEYRCELTRTPYGRRFISQGSSVGLSVSLNRYDLFHGHLILATESGRLGILEVHTVGVGAAIGHACLLLSAGSKGNRSMMPHSIAMVQQPRVPSSGLMPASDVLIRAKEAVTNRDTLIKLLAKHTENVQFRTLTLFLNEYKIGKISRTNCLYCHLSLARTAMRRAFYMDGSRAKEFGVIDMILWHGQESIIADVGAPEEWDKKAGIKSVDGF